MGGWEGIVGWVDMVVPMVVHTEVDMAAHLVEWAMVAVCIAVLIVRGCMVVACMEEAMV